MANEQKRGHVADLYRVFEQFYEPEFVRIIPFDPTSALLGSAVAKVSIAGVEYELHSATTAEKESIKAVCPGELDEATDVLHKARLMSPEFRAAAKIAFRGQLDDVVDKLDGRHSTLLAEAILVFLWPGPLQTRERAPGSCKEAPTSRTSETKESLSTANGSPDQTQTLSESIST